MIKAVLFDFGGTLFDYLPSNYKLLAKIGRKYGKKIEDNDPSLSEAFHTQEQYILQLFERKGNFQYNCLTEKDWLICDQILLDTIGVKNPKALDDLMVAFQKRRFQFQVYPDTLRTLKVLTQQKFKLGIISNFDYIERIPQRYQRLKEYGLYDIMDIIIISGEHSVKKPSSRIFELALQGLPGVSPNEAIYIGDSYIFDVLGARKANLIPILLDPNQGIKIDCISISKLSEIFSVIEKLEEI